MATSLQNSVAARNVGGSFTSFQWMGTTIARMTGVDDTGQNPMGGQSGGGFDVLHNLGEEYPAEIVTSRALMPGTLTFTITELWNGPAWQQLGQAAALAGIATASDIIGIFEAQDALNNPITAQMLIKPPTSNTWRGWNYTGLKITGVDQGEALRVDTLSISRQVTVTYLKRTFRTLAAGIPTQ